MLVRKWRLFPARVTNINVFIVPFQIVRLKIWLCIFSRSSKKKVEHGLLHGRFELGTSGLKSSGVTTAPAAELTPVNRYCPVFKTVA